MILLGGIQPWLIDCDSLIDLLICCNYLDNTKADSKHQDREDVVQEPLSGLLITRLREGREKDKGEGGEGRMGGGEGNVRGKGEEKRAKAKEQ